MTAERSRALCALLLAAGVAVAAPAHGAGRDALATVRGADTLAIAHMVWELAPGDSGQFGGAGAMRQQAGSRLWGATRQRIGALLGRRIGFVEHPDCTPACPSCPNAATFWLRFTGRGDTALVFVLMRERRARYVAGGRVVGFRRLGATADTLLALFRRALPHDTTLAGMRPADWPALNEDRAPGPDESAALDSVPRAVSVVQPEYPHAAGAAPEGVVWLRVLVSPDGAPREVLAMNAIAGLDSAAVTAVRQWRFRPAQCGGQPVWSWVPVPVRFTLH